MNEFDPQEKAREYQRDSVSLLFTIPVALLVFSINREGQIGWCPAWMSITWIAWVVLVLAVLVSSVRLWLVPATLQKFGQLSFGTWEKWNRRIFRVQISLIPLGFVLLCVAHLFHSIHEAPDRELKAKEAEIQRIEKWQDLHTREEALRRQVQTITPRQ